MVTIAQRLVQDGPCRVRVCDFFAARGNVDGKHGEHLALPEYVYHFVPLPIGACEDANSFSDRNADPTPPHDSIQSESRFSDLK